MLVYLLGNTQPSWGIYDNMSAVVNLAVKLYSMCAMHVDTIV